MRTVLSVIGPHSGCGKTLFVTHLLRHIRGLGCLKVSPVYDRPQTAAEAEGAVAEDYYLEDASGLDQPGTDTALYLAAGAAMVNRLRHRAGALAAGLDAALGQYPPAMPVVVESSSAVPLLQPAAVVLIVRPPMREMKPATEAILPRVTDLLINASDRQGSPTTEAERLQRGFPSLTPQFTWSADLICEPPPKDMLTRLQALVTPNHDAFDPR